jgi:hypothetical protein
VDGGVAVPEGRGGVVEERCELPDGDVSGDGVEGLLLEHEVAFGGEVAEEAGVNAVKGVEELTDVGAGVIGRDEAIGVGAFSAVQGGEGEEEGEDAFHEIQVRF